MCYIYTKPLSSSSSYFWIVVSFPAEIFQPFVPSSQPLFHRYPGSISGGGGGRCLPFSSLGVRTEALEVAPSTYVEGSELLVEANVVVLSLLIYNITYNIIYI